MRDRFAQYRERQRRKRVYTGRRRRPGSDPIGELAGEARLVRDALNREQGEDVPRDEWGVPLDPAHERPALHREDLPGSGILRFRPQLSLLRRIPRSLWVAIAVGLGGSLAGILASLLLLHTQP